MEIVANFYNWSLKNKQNLQMDAECRQWEAVLVLFAKWN
jgi:hypothetical protein